MYLEFLTPPDASKAAFALPLFIHLISFFFLEAGCLILAVLFSKLL
jgi:hypothetical protein